MKKRLLSLLLALMMVMSLLPVGALAAGNSYVVLHPATGTMPTGFKVQVGTKIDWGTVSEVNEKNYEVTIDLGKYNVSNTSFRLPMPEEIWEGVKMQYNPQTYVIAGAGGGVHKTPGASSLLANGGNFFYYYNLGKGESSEGLWNFRLEFNANGGSGAPAALTYSTNSKYEKGHSFVIPTTVPERPGYEFLGWARQSNATEPQYQPGGSYYMLISADGYNGGSQTDTLYAVWKDATSEPDTPTITDFTKERLTAAPSGITIPGVTVSYESPVVIPDGGTVTLLYKLTVTGDVGAAFVIADPDAAFVGSNCNVTTGADGGISGSIPLGGEAVLYVIKTFDRDDIVNGKLTNRAEIAAGDGSELGDGVGPTESETPATEPPEGPGDGFDFDLVDIYVTCDCDNDPQCEHATQTYRVSDGEFTVGKPVWNASAKQWEVYVTVSGSQARSYIDQAVAVWGNPHTGFETITPSMKLYTLIWDGEAWGKDASAAVTFEVECVHEPVLYTVTITPALPACLSRASIWTSLTSLTSGW